MCVALAVCFLFALGGAVQPMPAKRFGELLTANLAEPRYVFHVTRLYGSGSDSRKGLCSEGISGHAGGVVCTIRGGHFFIPASACAGQGYLGGGGDRERGAAPTGGSGRAGLPRVGMRC